MALIFTLSNKESFLRRTNAGLKLLLLLTLSLLLSSDNLISFSFVVALIAIIELTHRLGLFKQLLKNKFLLFIALFIFISDYLSTKALGDSIFSALKFITLLSLSIIFTSVTAPDESARSVASFLSPLFGKFAYQIASALELTLSLLPIIFVTATELLDARKSRAARFFSHPIKTISDFSTALISTLLSKIEAFADALESRGYNIYIKRQSPPFNKRDLLLLLTLLIAIGLLIYGKV